MQRLKNILLLKKTHLIKSEVGILVTILGYAFFMPYTKVEESFNMQAIHDILYNGFEISKYDHQTFPGVVPRTFLGALTVAIASSPVVFLMQMFDVRKRFAQYIVRFVLGFFLWFNLISYKRAVSKLWGRRVSRTFLLFTFCQFHFLYYSSRPLPNIFALILVLGAMASFLTNKTQSFIWQSGAAILIFRSELCIFFGPYLLLGFLLGTISFGKAIKTGIIAAVVLIGMTVLVDSFFWGRWLWPEGEVFWFNTILNKSSLWGRMPFHWYFSSAIPRALLLSTSFVFTGVVVDARARLFIIPCIVFLLIYSILPHKELRFIIYAIPILNTVGAIGFVKFLQKKFRKFMSQIFHISCFLHLLVNGIAVVFFIIASNLNYPGGQIMIALHNKVPVDSSVKVHICNYAAQTGVTRFLHENPHWTYNKSEGLESSFNTLINDFTHLIIERKYEEGSNLDNFLPFMHTHRILHTEFASRGYTWKYPFLVYKEKLLLLERNNLIDI